MKKVVISFLLLGNVCTIGSFAQKYDVYGLIVDGFTYERLDSVTVRFLKTDSTEVEKIISKDNNEYNCNFRSTIKSPGRYILRFSKPGYEDTYRTVNFRYKKYRITGGTFGRVVLKKKSTLTNRMLGDVTVTGTRIKMIMKGDTIVYNADAFQLREGSMLDQLVAMLPGAELRKGGEIYVNGKKISSLLVNGENFFKGNARIALENLPSFMVDKVKVYDIKPDLEKLVGKNINVHAGMLENWSDQTVMDVNLKKKYSIGWIANGELGGGTDDHYSIKAFALRFTPQSRLAFMGYSNNVYANSYYDANGTWQEPGGSDNITTHELSSDLLIKDKAGRYKLNNIATFKWKEQKSEEYQNTINYLDTKDIYGTRQSNSTYRDWHLRENLDFNYESKEEQTLSYFKFKPGIFYNNYSNASFMRQAEWNRKITEKYMGESLDSLFTDGSAGIYRKNLISSLRQSQQNEGHYLNASGETGSSWSLHGYGDLTFNASGFYQFSKNRNLFESAAYNRTGLQNRFSDQSNDQYNYNMALGYSIAYFFGESVISIDPSYMYKQQYMSHSRDYYRLEDTEYSGEPIDNLASMKDAMTQFIDDTNSVYSDSWKRTHQPQLHLYFYNYNEAHRFGHRFEFSLPMRIDQVKYNYLRGLIDTQLRRNYYFFEPKAEYRFDRNVSSKLERHITLSYGISHSIPNYEYLIDYRDDATPLVVRTGNPDLKQSTHHKLDFSLYNRRWGKRYRGLRWEVGYELWQNLIGQSMLYDLNTGVRTYRPENINGNWAASSRLHFNSTLDQNKRWNYQLTTNFNYRHSEDYVNSEQSTSALRTGTNRFITSQRLLTYYGSKYYDFSAEVNGEWIHATSDRFDKQDVFNVNYRVSYGMPLPWKFEFSTSLLLNTRYGYSDDKFNTKQLIWSARLKRFFFNGRFGMELEAFDLLNEMSSYSYSLNAQMQTETYRNVLRRYVMLNLSFRLNKEPKK